MKFKKKILESGLRIITVPDNNSLAATILVMVETGSKYETKKINGLSHFLEHMCFKGTERRPRSMMISTELDSLGAQYNAFTGQEYTGYYAKVAAKYLDKAIDLVSDLYLHPIFNADEIEKEKGVIIEEINMYEDLPQRKVQEILMELIYGDQPAGWNIAGDKEKIMRMKREDFIDYRALHYVAGATTVVVAGNFDQKAIFKKIEESFEGISRGKKHGKKATVEKQARPRSVLKYKQSDQTHMALGVRAFGLNDKKHFVVDVLAGVLGGGMSSRLFHRVREELGAAYYVRADNELYTDHGFLEITVGSDNARSTQVLSVIMEELRRLVKETISEKELKKVKDYIIGNMFLSLETSDAIASFFGGQETIEHKTKSPKELAQNMRKITVDDLRAVAAEIFRNDRLNFALIGPHKDIQKFEKILKI